MLLLGLGLRLLHFGFWLQVFWGGCDGVACFGLSSVVLDLWLLIGLLVRLGFGLFGLFVSRLRCLG